MNTMRIHLVNVSESEGEASIAYHGHVTNCRNGCTKPVVAMMLRRPPGEHKWGQNIAAAGFCEEHETWLLQTMAALKAGRETEP